MDLNYIKKRIFSFYIITIFALFAFIVVFTISMYFICQRKVDSVELDKRSVEINLPVANWGKYINLSKQLDK